MQHPEQIPRQGQKSPHTDSMGGTLRHSASLWCIQNLAG